MNYNTNNSDKARRILVILLAMIIAAGIGWLIGSMAQAGAEDQLATCWVMCKPGTQVNVRRRPMADSKSETQLDAGERILTDGETRDGWVHVYGVGENGGGWVYAGYVATEQPVTVGERYVCVAPRQAACRRWIGGPQIDGHRWIRNGENVDVFLMADGWAVTSRGYIQTEWLEADPE